MFLIRCTTFICTCTVVADMQKATPCAYTLCLVVLKLAAPSSIVWFCTSLCLTRCSLLLQGGPLFLLQDLSTNGGRLSTRSSDTAALVTLSSTYPATLSCTYFQCCAGQSLPPLHKRCKQFEVTVSEKGGALVGRHVSAQARP